MGGGGAEKTFQTLANYWVRNGLVNGIDIICTDSDDVAYSLDSRIRVHALKSGRLIKVVGRFPAMFIQAIELFFRLKAIRPDVSMSSLARANLVHVLSTFLDHKIPAILCEQTASFSFYRNSTPFRAWAVTALIRKLYPLSDGIVAASTLVGDDLVQAGVPFHKVKVVYNPIPFQVNPAVSQSQRKCEKRVVTIGRLSEEKDHQTLLRAFAIVNAQIPDARLAIVGQGPLESQTKAWITELDLDGCVELPGWESKPERRLSESDLFVLTSTSEGFGVVLVEALACGLPVISTSCPGGPSEILENGESGVLVPVGNPEKLAAEIVRVLQMSSSERQVLRQKSYQRASRFAVEVISEEYLAVLRARVSESASR